MWSVRVCLLSLALSCRTNDGGETTTVVADPPASASEATTDTGPGWRFDDRGCLTNPMDERWAVTLRASLSEGGVFAGTFSAGPAFFVLTTNVGSAHIEPVAGEDDDTCWWQVGGPVFEEADVEGGDVLLTIGDDSYPIPFDPSYAYLGAGGKYNGLWLTAHSLDELEHLLDAPMVWTSTGSPWVPAFHIEGFRAPRQFLEFQAPGDNLQASDTTLRWTPGASRSGRVTAGVVIDMPQRYFYCETQDDGVWAPPPSFWAQVPEDGTYAVFSIRADETCDVPLDDGAVARLLVQHGAGWGAYVSP